MRGLRVMEALTEAGARGKLGVIELSAACELSAATTHRLLATLSGEGYVQQDGSHDGYRLGPRLFALASAAESDMASLRLRALPAMTSLRDLVDETVNLAVLDRRHIIYVDQVESGRPVRAFNRIGNRVPAHASAAGKALLAEESEAVLSVLAQEAMLDALTADTITSGFELVAHLGDVRNRGFALDLGEYDPEVFCVAAAIPGPRNRPPAAVSVSGPAERMRRIDLGELGSQVAAAAADIEASGESV